MISRNLLSEHSVYNAMALLIILLPLHNWMYLFMIKLPSYRYMFGVPVCVCAQLVLIFSRYWLALWAHLCFYFHYNTGMGTQFHAIHSFMRLLCLPIAFSRIYSKICFISLSLSLSLSLYLFLSSRLTKSKIVCVIFISYKWMNPVISPVLLSVSHSRSLVGSNSRARYQQSN